MTGRELIKELLHEDLDLQIAVKIRDSYCQVININEISLSGTDGLTFLELEVDNRYGGEKDG